MLDICNIRPYGFFDDQYSGLNAKGSAAEKLVFNAKVKAYGDINLEHVATEKKVSSKFGKIAAAHSALGDVVASGKICLQDTTLKSAKSLDGRVTIKQPTLTDSKISNVIAKRDVTLKRVSVEGDVKSQSCVFAKKSQLGNVSAIACVRLTDSSAKDIKAKFGSVYIEQTGETPAQISNILAHEDIQLKNVALEKDIQSQFGNVFAESSTLQKVKAVCNIDILNSSATDLFSDFGTVSVRQTDGVKRSIAQVTGLNEIVVQNSIIEDVTLHVDQDEKAILDLKDSEVGKVVIKINDLLSTSSRVAIDLFGDFSENSFFSGIVNDKEFHSPAAFTAYLLTGKEEKADATPKAKHFSLLIKGEEMPKNITFEGFETDEISSEKTDEGILVKGEKKR